jgi:Zn-dependent peptidase ImmA (M78 family)/DNA-binding XRE family transcriptional regulator
MSVRFSGIHRLPVHPSPPDELALARRLAIARAQARLSQSEVAEALAIPRSAVSLIESGVRSISGIELARLAELYGEPVTDLLYAAELEGDEDETRQAAVLSYFRAAGELRPQHEAWLTDAAERWRDYAHLEQAVHGVQRYELPTYRVPPGRPYEQGERLAEQERRRLGIGITPIRSVIALLEDEGVKVLMVPFDGVDDVSGCYFFSEELGPCVIINAHEPPSRRRFTAAHEYAHFLVDRAPVEGEICDHDRSKEPFEQRANAFAASFLLPARGIEETLTDATVERWHLGPEDVVLLMYRFGVSYEAVLWRLLNLDWIKPHQREALSEVASTRVAENLGYGDQKPGATEPKPSRFRKLALEAWRVGKLTKDEVARHLDISAELVEATFGAAEPKSAKAPRRHLEEPNWF